MDKYELDLPEKYYPYIDSITHNTLILQRYGPLASLNIPTIRLIIPVTVGSFSDMDKELISEAVWDIISIHLPESVRIPRPSPIVEVTVTYDDIWKISI